MKHNLPNNRTLMIASADILDYFNSHPIIGRTITDILPSEYDYRIGNFDDLVDEMDMSCNRQQYRNGRIYQSDAG